MSAQIFHPRRTDVEPNFQVPVHGATLGCYRHFWDDAAGHLLHFHGNGELAAEYSEHLADVFVRRGVNVCFAEYRGYGFSTGEPALVSMQEDGLKIASDLAIPPERLVVFGRSLGSLYAIELAARLPTIAGLVLESAVADLLEERPFTEMHESEHDVLRAEVRKHFNLEAKLASYPGPVLIMHAIDDRMVDRSHAERLYAWSKGKHRRLVMFPDGDHNTIMQRNLAAYCEALEAFLQVAGLGIANSWDA